MPSNQELETLGYTPVYQSEKFEIWYRENSQRVYINILHPVTAEDVALAVEKTRPLNIPLMDLITDHSLMPRVDLVQDEDLSVCFDEFFDRFNVRNIVRICDVRMNCDICVPLDSKLSSEEKGRIQGRVNTFTDANRLLDHQHGVP
ncbi:MAG: hypothetical protein C4576_35235 [Desulfobacteraceae bacterium]|nr:MAG: hypothetical protein C4576_35235 [Desulfobacteraceae bacterium]